MPPYVWLSSNKYDFKYEVHKVTDMDMQRYYLKEKNSSNVISMQTNDQPGTLKYTRTRCKICSFIHNVEKIVGTQAIYLDYRSSRVHLCQCHLLHNLHLEKIYIGEKEDD